MISGIKRTKHSVGVLMYALALFSLIFSFSINAQSNGDQKELDQILRKELGVTDPKPKVDPLPKEKTDLSPTDVNPIQERYAEAADDSPSATWILLKILFVLVILVGTGYFLVQKMQESRAAKYPVKGFMKVLSTLPLSQTASLQIIEVGNRILVLGVAEGAVNLVSEINGPDEKSQITRMKDEADPYTPNFLESLLESLQAKAQSKKIRINRNQFETAEQDSSGEIQRKSREGLDRIRKHRELLEGGS